MFEEVSPQDLELRRIDCDYALNGHRSYPFVECVKDGTGRVFLLISVRKLRLCGLVGNILVAIDSSIGEKPGPMCRIIFANRLH